MTPRGPIHGTRFTAAGACLWFCWQMAVFATDWPQYRGPTTDGVSTDLISTNWQSPAPSLVWSNMSLTNGFSTFAVSQGRAFTQISRDQGAGFLEYCVAVGDAPWDPASWGDGGDGNYPYMGGDGPRSTPSVQNGRVFVLSGTMSLICMNATNGAVIWSADLKALYGAQEVLTGWNNAASPRFDNDLIFVNLNTPDNQNLSAFRMSDGSRVWGNTDEQLIHATPVVATILGTRQVVFATFTGVVGVDRNSGDFLWKFTYPWGPIYTSMGASPVVYSNIVFCTAGYNKGSSAFQVDFTGGQWHATNTLWTQTFPDNLYQSIWMTPVIYRGYIYGNFGYNGYISNPLNCIELMTGLVMWSQPNFGKGGTILVNNYLLSLTEDGQLVLVKPDPTVYTELARFQAFHFDENTLGKCWNGASFSNGRVYARSTIGGLAVDVSGPPALKLLTPQFVSSNQVQLSIGTVDGTPIASNRVPGIEVHATNALGSSPTNWPKLTNPMVLTPGGQLRLTNTTVGKPTQVYITVERP
jgi:outer membrane protein assembly factor BamB